MCSALTQEQIDSMGCRLYHVGECSYVQASFLKVPKNLLIGSG